VSELILRTLVLFAFFAAVLLLPAGLVLVLR